MDPLDLEHIVAIREMMYEADIDPTAPLDVIKIVRGEHRKPHHYILKYADLSRMILPYEAVDERAKGMWTDWWDCGSGCCRDHCQSCHWGCQWVPGWLDGDVKC